MPCNLKNKKVLLVVASTDYQPVEYSVPKKMLEDEGIVVITASDKPGAAIANDGSSTNIDITLDKINITNYAGIFFIGGPGAETHLDNGISYHLLSEARKHLIPYGAICWSVRILAKAWALQGKKATGWDGDNALRSILEGHDAMYEEGKMVVTDGEVATAVGPQAAKEFGQAIIRILCKEVLSD